MGLPQPIAKMHDAAKPEWSLAAGVVYSLNKVVIVVQPDLITFSILVMFGGFVVSAFAQTVASVEFWAYPVGWTIGSAIGLYLVAFRRESVQAVIIASAQKFKTAYETLAAACAIWLIAPLLAF
jgi:hypothetical protein